MNIYLGKSLAGHDKNHIYIIYKEETDSYILVNGSTKTLDKPKRKNKKHIQLIKYLPKSVMAKLDDIDDLSDDVIREIVDCYNDYLNSKR